MKKVFLITLLSLFFFYESNAQKVIKLWPEEIPFSNGTIGGEELLERGRIRNVQDPTITVYLPEKDKANGAAVVICPGGGYRLLAMQHEGHDIAKWLNTIGVAGIVLKNRLPTSDHVLNKSEVALFDAQRAVRMTRYHAEAWGIELSKIGIMGFSAGGHLASTVGTHYDLGMNQLNDPIQQLSCRPDFMILVYPVISMTADFSHKGSMKNLLGPEPSDVQRLRFSNERQITPDTPPTILVHSSDDEGVHVANSIAFYESLVENGIVAELHVFNSGKHGYGLGRRDNTSHNIWSTNVEAFLKDVIF